MTEIHGNSSSDIVFYGVTWCGDCRRARRIFAENSISFIDIDIDHDTAAAEFVKKQNNGFQSVPTIVFPDGTTLTEPDNITLIHKLESYKKTA